jgi:SAM-dependent methyltransferase
LERHRLIWLFFRQKTNLFDGRPKRLLHVAPEIQLSHRLKRVPGVDYLSIDLAWGRAMMRADITNLLFPHDSFDVIYCSHVLEHIPNDHKAMTEFYRVLKPSGWAILQVPIKGKTTFEDPSVTSPAERERLFGQSDHVRIYGEDYVDRLERAGFKVTVDQFAQQLPDGEAGQIVIDRSEKIYFCSK